MTPIQAAAVAAGALTMSLGLGVRQAFGLFVAPLDVAFGIGIATTSFAVALHNLSWGLAQPLLGAVADKRGTTPVIAVGALIFAAGLLLPGLYPAGWTLILGLGVLTGIGMAALGFGVTLAGVGRSFGPGERSQAIGLVSAGGSFGQMMLLPLAATFIAFWGANGALIALGLMLLVALPLGRPIDRAAGIGGGGRSDSRAAVRAACGDRAFLLLTAGFFTCGFQLAFLVTHLPTYLHLCGMPPDLAAWALAVVGGFNIIGSYAAGQLGARLPPHLVLAGIYLVRGAAILAFFLAPKSEAGTLVFAAVMGVTWLGTVPLTSTVIARLFGVANLGMLYGVAFLSHQVGSFLGAWLGGLTFAWTGAYDAIFVATAVAGVTAALFNLPIRLPAQPKPAIA